VWREKLQPVLNSLAYEFMAFAGVAVLVFIRGLRGRLQAGQSVVSNLEVQTLTKESDMQKEVAIGKEGKADLKLENGKLFLSAGYDGVQVDANLVVGIEIDLFIDKLKEKIPGKIDDAVLDLLKVALKAV
jgi:hypothetical protein